MSGLLCVIAICDGDRVDGPRGPHAGFATPANDYIRGCALAVLQVADRKRRLAPARLDASAFARDKAVFRNNAHDVGAIRVEHGKGVQQGTGAEDLAAKVQRKIAWQRGCYRCGFRCGRGRGVGGGCEELCRCRRGICSLLRRGQGRVSLWRLVGGLLVSDLGVGGIVGLLLQNGLFAWGRLVLRGIVLVLGVLHGGHVRFRLCAGAGFRFGEFPCRLGFLLRGALRDGGGDNGGGDNGNGTDPNNPDGNGPDGNNPDGNNPDGNNPDGNNPDGNNPDGSKSNTPKTGDTRLIWLVIALAVIFVATFAATYYNRRKSKHHGA